MIRYRNTITSSKNDRTTFLLVVPFIRFCLQLSIHSKSYWKTNCKQQHQIQQQVQIWKASGWLRFFYASPFGHLTPTKCFNSKLHKVHAVERADRITIKTLVHGNILRPNTRFHKCMEEILHISCNYLRFFHMHTSLANQSDALSVFFQRSDFFFSYSMWFCFRTIIFPVVLPLLIGFLDDIILNKCSSSLQITFISKISMDLQNGTMSSIYKTDAHKNTKSSINCGFSNWMRAFFF